LLLALRGSAHQSAAIAAMNQLLRLPDQAVAQAFIQTLASMESAQQFPFPGDRDAADPDAGRRREASDARGRQLRGELGGVVERKLGEAKAVSLDTVVSGMRFDSVKDNLRAELASVFMDLPWRRQNQLLNGQWKNIAGPAMIPVLRQIYENPQQTTFQSLAPVAVQRLYELDPARTRTLILDDMKRDPPRLPFETLAILPDATLPEMDPVLLDHLEHNTGTDLIARYATADILDGVKTWHAKRDATMRAGRSSGQPDVASSLCDPALVGYYLRVDPPWGEQVLRGLLNDRSAYPRGGCWMGIVGRTAKFQTGPAWEKVAIEALADGVVAVKSDAVKALGEYGSAAAQQAVMDAFSAWHDWWKDKPGEMVSERQFEQAFFEAAVRGQNWIADGDELEKIRDLCITSGCRGQAEQYIAVWADAVPVSIGESGGGDVRVWFAQYNPTSLDAARARLLQVPAGTRLQWNPIRTHSTEIEAWMAGVDRDLATRGVVITR
jgi:HEAT repeat protein